MELFCCGACAVGVVATLVVAFKRRTPTQADTARTQGGMLPSSGPPAGYVKITSKYGGTCEVCTGRFPEGTVIYWAKSGEVRHASPEACEKARQNREADAFARLMDRLEKTKGAATRRSLLAKGEEEIRDPALRTKLLIEASRLDSEQAVEKAFSLKTASARRRRLEEALAAIRADPVPDEMQANQIEWLEAALREVEKDEKGGA